MTFEQYQQMVQDMKVYPKQHAIVYPALKLTGEAGEVAEKVGKWLRGDNDGILDNRALAQELGDVLWYITALAIDINYDLAEVAFLNAEKLRDRAKRGVLKGSGDNR